MASHDNRPGASCPSHEDLVAFNNGNLPPAALEMVADHLSDCASCLTASWRSLSIRETFPPAEASIEYDVSSSRHRCSRSSAAAFIF